MPGDPGATVVTNSCALSLCARGCGCAWHPAFPTPSWAVKDDAKSGRICGAAGWRRVDRMASEFLHPSHSGAPDRRTRNPYIHAILRPDVFRGRANARPVLTEGWRYTTTYVGQESD